MSFWLAWAAITWPQAFVVVVLGLPVVLALLALVLSFFGVTWTTHTQRRRE